MGIVEDTAEGIGEGVGAVAGGILAAIPPVIEEVFPALIDGVSTGIKVLRNELKENIIPITTWGTIIACLYFTWLYVKMMVMVG